MALLAAADEEKYKLVLDMASELGRVIMVSWSCKSSDDFVKTLYHFGCRNAYNFVRDGFDLHIADNHHQLRR